MGDLVVTDRDRQEAREQLLRARLAVQSELKLCSAPMSDAEYGALVHRLGQTLAVIQLTRKLLDPNERV